MSLHSSVSADFSPDQMLPMPSKQASQHLFWIFNILAPGLHYKRLRFKNKCAQEKKAIFTDDCFTFLSTSVLDRKNQGFRNLVMKNVHCFKKIDVWHVRQVAEGIFDVFAVFNATGEYVLYYHSGRKTIRLTATYAKKVNHHVKEYMKTI